MNRPEGLSAAEWAEVVEELNRWYDELEASWTAEIQPGDEEVWGCDQL